MSLFFRSAKLTAPANENQWSGCFSENNLAFTIEVEVHDGIQASHLGKSLMDEILELNKTIQEKGHAKTDKLIKFAANNKSIRLLIIILLENSHAYLGTLGEGIIVLKRENKSGIILQGQGITEGEIKKGDRLFLYSAALSKLLGSDKIGEIISEERLEDCEEDLAPLLSQNKGSSGTAFMAVSVDEISEALSDEDVFVAPKENYLNKLKEKIRSLKFLQSQPKYLKIALILTVVLILSILWGVISNKGRLREKEYAQALTLVSQMQEEAKNLIDLNPIRARELISSSKLTLSGLLSKTRKNSGEYKNLKRILSDLTSLEISAYRIFKLTSVPVFFDLTLIKPQAKIDRISAYKSTKAILDENNKTVFFLDTSTKQAEIVAGADNVKNAADIAIHGNYIYLLNEDGIIEVDIKEKKAKKIIEKDPSWGEIPEIEAFAGNLYLLDKSQNNIWKYTRGESAFSSRGTYVGSGVPVNFSKTSQLAIDGSIWVSGGEEVIKLTGGVLDSFRFQEFADSLTSIDSFSTSDEEKNIYILDKSLTRIIVFDKDGVYQSQYQWDELKNAQQIVASEKEEKIFVTMGNKIYAVDLK